MIVFFKSKRGNFGDDLNTWLFPQLLSERILKSPEINFLGIGTILFTEITQKLVGEKIIFGSGYRFGHFWGELHPSWKVSFLRGPISSYLLFRDTHHYITDSAYAVLLTQYQPPTKQYKLAFMPHYQTRNLLDFKKVCETANIKYIDPCQSVEKTLGEIASSELLITEAMHGAILADAFRVPWTRIQIYSHYFEGRQVAEQKWLDWLYSMELKPQTVSFSPLLNQLLPPRFVWRQLAKIVLNQLLSDVGQFSQLAQLSSEPILQSKVAQLHQAMEDLNFEYR